MAGKGPPPKDPGQRRRRNAPARGEWVDLEPLVEAVLPEWDSSWTCPRELWDAWRADPVTGQYTPADVAACVVLGREFAGLASSEQRLRMDGLGLSPKGKRDLRWRVVESEPAVVRPRLAEVRRLRAVEKAS